MVSQRELQEVVTQINAILERLDKRLQLVESTQNSLLHELKDDIKKEAKKRGKNG
jgi:predicted DNA-binding protein YlxM (UPF0122 family)